jgi:hypothetical protein
VWLTDRHPAPGHALASTTATITGPAATGRRNLVMRRP